MSDIEINIDARGASDSLSGALRQIIERAQRARAEEIAARLFDEILPPAGLMPWLAYNERTTRHG